MVSLPRIDWGPWLVSTALLFGSLAYARTTAPAAREFRAFGGRVLFDLPPRWTAHEHTRGEHVSFVAQLPTLHTLAPSVLVEPVEGHETGGTDALFRDLEVARMQEARAAAGIGYRVLHVDEREGAGNYHSTWVWYAIVRNPPDVAPGAAVLPIVVIGVDVLVITESGSAWHVAAYEPAHESADDEDELQKIVDGLRFL